MVGWKFCEDFCMYGYPNRRSKLGQTPFVASAHVLIVPPSISIRTAWVVGVDPLGKISLSFFYPFPYSDLLAYPIFYPLPPRFSSWEGSHSRESDSNILFCPALRTSWLSRILQFMISLITIFKIWIKNGIFKICVDNH